MTHFKQFGKYCVEFWMKKHHVGSLSGSKNQSIIVRLWRLDFSFFCYIKALSGIRSNLAWPCWPVTLLPFAELLPLLHQAWWQQMRMQLEGLWGWDGQHPAALHLIFPPGCFPGEIVSAFIYLFTKISTLLLKKNVLGNVACIYRQVGFQ